MKIITALLLLLLSLSGCQHHERINTVAKNQKISNQTSRVPARKIFILPLGKASAHFIEDSRKQLSQYLPGIAVLPAERMPTHCYYAPEKRYRADSLIHWMHKRAKENEIWLGITEQDISTTKGDDPDYGVMGLGFRPGNACVASDFRVRNKSNFFKVSLHELGHTMGLAHCPVKTCFMRDAEGKDPTDEETGFCTSCKGVLRSKHWIL